MKINQENAIWILEFKNQKKSCNSPSNKQTNKRTIDEQVRLEAKENKYQGCFHKCSFSMVN